TPLSAMLEQVREMNGVAAWPESCPPPGPDLVVRPLVNPSPVYPWYVIWHRDRLTQSVEAFRAAARVTADEHGWMTVDPPPPPPRQTSPVATVPTSLTDAAFRAGPETDA